MPNIYQKVNEYLAKWDPIGLPQEIADVEYVDYVPEIVKALSDKDELYNCLKSLLDKIGTDEGEICIDHKKELRSRIDELQQLEKTSLSHEVFFRIINKNRQDGVCSWFIAYDDKIKCVCREIGTGDTGNVITKAPSMGCHDYWLHSNLTIKDYVVSFPFEFISKEEFESVWNEELVGVDKKDYRK